MTLDKSQYKKRLYFFLTIKMPIIIILYANFTLVLKGRKNTNTNIQLLKWR